MKRLKIMMSVLAIILSSLCLFSGGGVQSDAPGVQLRAAIEKEEVEGDLQAAIEQYKIIIAGYGENRSVAARALLRLGGCYEKLGQEEAQKTYRQLIADYPEQQQEVVAARQRLAALTTTPNRKSQGMAVRMLWSETETEADTSGDISPDGRYLSLMGGTGDLAIRDLETNESRILTNEGDWEKSATYVFGSRWSPDGKRIAYGWVTMPYRREMEEIWDLRLIDSIGKNGKPRILFRGKAGQAIMPAGWFPDAKSILALSTVKGQDAKILRVFLDDGRVQVLSEINWPSGPPRVRLSPDGRYIAYEMAADPHSMNSDIFLLPASRGSKISLVAGPYDDRLLDWTPDGQRILFSSNRSGTYDAWLLRVEDGVVKGTPELVRQDFGTALPIGFAPTGDFYFGREAITHDIFVADWDSKTGKLLSTPKNATEHYAGSTYWPAWSRDGKQLAYIVHRGALYRLAENQVRIRDLETGRERTLAKVSGSVGSVSWSPDGKSLLLCGVPEGGTSSCWVVDAESGNVLREAAVPQGEQRPMPGAIWAPSGNAIFYSTWLTNEGRGRVVRYDLASGNERILYSLDRFHNPIVVTISPDGKFLVFVLESLLEGNKALGPRIMLIPASGGNDRELMRSEQPIPRASLNWSLDSRYVYFVRRGLDAEADRLCRVSIGDGSVVELALDIGKLSTFRLAPNGRQIAFTQFGKAHGEIWVMENFLPK